MKSRMLLFIRKVVPFEIMFDVFLRFFKNLTRFEIVGVGNFQMNTLYFVIYVFVIVIFTLFSYFILHWHEL